MKKSAAEKQDDSNGNTPEVSAREKLLNDQPEVLQQFGMDLLPVMIQVTFWEHIYKFSYSCQGLLKILLLIDSLACGADLWFKC